MAGKRVIKKPVNKKIAEQESEIICSRRNLICRILLPIILIALLLLVLFIVFNSGLTGNSVYSKCIDSDNTIYPIVNKVTDDESFFIAGNVTQGYTTVYDRCEDVNVVAEYYCEKGTIRNAKLYGCPGDCKDGACVR
ncbi:hypothetical protein COV15_00495 [Candidatus Woesearchaeota archaeon CG10_big_fil_rev_8_21_14_0_10_34_12]|nr:MAG: hypothetical protein COV15_00495 [Candidatus Woesearchaeota archaeon CG10_big_fil_rev_8_21_14_0_10_34_12]